MTLEQELARGMEAQKAYDIVRDRLSLMKEEAHRAIGDTSYMQVSKREESYFLIMAIKQLEQSFLTEIQTAKLAKKQLETENG